MAAQHVLEIQDLYQIILLRLFKKKIYMEFQYYLEIETLREEFLHI
jgi:hypothetical protein